MPGQAGANDVQIILSAIDESKAAFASVEGNMARLRKEQAATNATLGRTDDAITKQGKSWTVVGGKLREATTAYQRVIRVAGGVTAALSVMNDVLEVGKAAWDFYGAAMQKAATRGDLIEAQKRYIQTIRDTIEENRKLGNLSIERTVNMLAATDTLEQKFKAGIIDIKQYNDGLRSLGRELIAFNKAAAGGALTPGAQNKILISDLKVWEAQLKDSFETGEISAKEFGDQLDRLSKERFASASNVAQAELKAAKTVQDSDEAQVKLAEIRNQRQLERINIAEIIRKGEADTLRKAQEEEKARFELSLEEIEIKKTATTNEEALIPLLEQQNSLIRQRIDLLNQQPKTIGTEKEMLDLRMGIERNKQFQIQAAEQVKERERAINERRFMAVHDMFGNMAGAAQAFGEKGLVAYKVFATAQAIMDTYRSAIAAYAALVGIPFVGPVLATAAAAAAIAFGAAQIAAIQSTTTGFDEGGYTGDGGKHEVAGTVHHGEYVFSAADVSRAGLENIVAFRNSIWGGQMDYLLRPSFAGGFADGGFVGAQGGSVTPKLDMSIGLVSNRQDRRELQRKEGFPVMLQELRKRSNRVRL